MLHPLKDRILGELRISGRKAAELAEALGVDRRDVVRCLSRELTGKVQQGSDYRWRRVEEVRRETPVAAPQAATPEIAKLCRYYLECIGQGMDEGVSVFAQSRYGEPDYAELPSLPMVVGGGGDWFNAPGTGRVVGKVRQDRAKLVAWLGYPVRLRRHRTAQWEGFFVEPILLWRLDLGEQSGDLPRIEEDAPLINAMFLRSIAISNGLQLAEESARLMEELGLNVAVADLPEVEDLIERLARIRPDWDWQEPLDAADCAGVTLSELDKEGIYNRAVVIPGERSPYTQGLETELKTLRFASNAQLQGTAIGRWLAKDLNVGAASTGGEPLIEVIAMNTEQRAAVLSALTMPHTVVSAAPGTGTSQVVVTNLLVNAALRGMKVLFASKNNKAVDVVEARVNGLGNRPVLLRLGSKEYQGRLAGYLTQLLAGNPGAEDRANYDDGLERHRSLAARLAELDQIQRQTLDARNTVDRLDAEAGDARRLFLEQLSAIDEALVSRAQADLESLARATDSADREWQGRLTKVFWNWYSAGRRRNLERTVSSVLQSATALGLVLPAKITNDSISAFRDVAKKWESRLVAAQKVLTLRRAMQVLERSVAFEDIAQQRAALAEQIAQNSQRLWRDWVQLAPTRLSAQQRKDAADYAAVLQLTTGPDAQRVHSSVRQRARALQAKVTELFNCWAVTSLSARGRVPLDPGYFDLVVIDEASQCDIASALPLLYRAKRSVIIGDPRPVWHISALSRARDLGLQYKHGLVDTRVDWVYSASSLYDLAASIVSQASIVNLRDHRRSHADSTDLSSTGFYGDRLRGATRCGNLRNGAPGIVWQDVTGSVLRPSSGGAQNHAEALAVVKALEDLLVNRHYGGTVGVVTPFRGQAQLLQQMIQESSALLAVRDKSELLVDTVHRFPSDDRDVMFFSPVVSEGTPIGALTYLRSNGDLFNVAITRTRGLFYVVGDRSAAASCGVDYFSAFAAMWQQK